jgi:hypothetical protein
LWVSVTGHHEQKCRHKDVISAAVNENNIMVGA